MILRKQNLQITNIKKQSRQNQRYLYALNVREDDRKESRSMVKVGVYIKINEKTFLSPKQHHIKKST